jgi:ADP-heptose:LPS heptosyltransferase
VLKCGLSPGDVLMLTAAVRDLHLTYPRHFLIDVRTPCPALWENNPYLTALDENAKDVRIVECHYPLIHQSNSVPYHFVHGFRLFLNDLLGLNIAPHGFGGDVHLADEERRGRSQVDEIIGAAGTEFWIIVSGGKTDFTAKWWDPERCQQVVDHFAGRLQFVQCGEAADGHVHPPLRGVINLVGKTDLRQLVRLMYHAAGVVCPVTMMMHLASAVETKPGRPKRRPCVVVAGGREPSQWEAYPHHQYLHTIGCLPCCQGGGCWKSRVEPLGDGDAKDAELCTDPVTLASGRKLPRCLDLISANQVIDAIERYLAFGGECNVLTEANARQEFEAAAEAIGEYPGGFEGRGIVIPAGGEKYFASAWVNLNMLRHVGCALPVELWHLGPGEMTEQMRRLVEPLGAACVDALEVRRRRPCRILNGWELKPYALLHSRFREAVLLDADNFPLVDPSFLFDEGEYVRCGAVFWPDRGRMGPEHNAWRLTGAPYRDEPEFETGQAVVDKRRCWRPLNLAMWMNAHSDFWYRHVYGDKETFHLAWRKLDAQYAMPARGLVELPAGVMCQHDFEGRRVFQHRSRAKWTVSRANPRVPGFIDEDLALSFLDRLRERWSDGRG